MNSNRLPAVILGLALGISAAIAYRTLRPDDGRQFSLEDYLDLPASFASADEARAWARGHATGGRVDQLDVPGRDVLVVFQHGSGIPVVRVGIYRRGFLRWNLLARPGVPAGLRGEFLRASADETIISVTGDRSGARGILIELK